MNEIKTIGVLTSGGDAPGMNACIRSITRVARNRDLRVLGVVHGYTGLIEGNYTEMIRSSVSNIIQRGGTILKSSRSAEFMTKEGRQRAANAMKSAGMDGLIVIGGDGTNRGASDFYEEHNIPVVSCPGTIDNDVYGTDETIGFDTAVNTALDSIDKIRDTADAFERTFYIEVMGRHAGFIALNVGLGSGAEFIAIPEAQTTVEAILEVFRHQRSTKRSNMIVVAEGDDAGGALKLAEEVKKHTGVDYRVTILGHIQRGGSPTARDRILASKLGGAAVVAMMEGKHNVMVGEVAGKIAYTPMKDTYEKKKQIDEDLVSLSKILAM